jgi:chitin disaccharide deacetylase
VKKNLIVNADDFGLTGGVNAGIIRAHEQGIVTSASLMVRYPAAAEAAAYARSHARLAVGLHVDLAEWEYVNEEWRPAYMVVNPDDEAAVATEVAWQLNRFRELVGRDPAHLDSHQHVHHTEPVLSVLKRLAAELGVVLRSVTPGVNYCGDFYGQSNKGFPCHEAISVEALIAVLKKIPGGVTEMGCHPAAVADVESVYREERTMECATLCDPRVKAAVTEAGIELCAYAWDRVRGSSA